MSSPRVPAARASWLRLVACAATLTVLTLGMPSVPASADQGWLRPVPGPVVNPFRAPLARFAAGHRGVDFAAAAGSAVRAANDGRVAFAGTVAGSLHVVIAHDNGIRTSYSFLARVDVRVGQVVARGQIVGLAGGHGESHGPGVLHFGVRIGDRYVDPMMLFGPTDLTELVRLVPVQERDAAEHSSPALERREVERFFRDLGWERDCAGGFPVAEQVCDGITYVAEKGADLGGKALDFGLSVLHKVWHLGAAAFHRLVRAMRTVAKALADAAKGVAGALARVAEAAASGALRVYHALVKLGQQIIERLTSCPQPSPAAHPKGSGNVVVAIGGLGSSRGSDHGGALKSSFHFEAKVLGYPPQDVTYYSYDPTSPTYSKDETYGDLMSKARLLGEQLKAAAAEHPGRTFDLVAHSQGGVIVDLFLDHLYRGHESEYPRIANVVTFASPHEGTPLANFGHAVSKLPVVGQAVDAFQPELDATSLDQLREGSPTMQQLWTDGRHVPNQIRYLSIMGSEDIRVPSTSGDVPGADRIVVPVGSLSPLDDHSGILRDDDALSAAQAQLSGGHPDWDCGPLTDVPSAVFSAAVRMATTYVSDYEPTNPLN